MLKEKSWDEFRDSGMLWFINSILHLFGWAIVLVSNSANNNLYAYPARTNFRGFSQESNTQGYIKVSEYLKDNIDDLLKEAKS